MSKDNITSSAEEAEEGKRRGGCANLLRFVWRHCVFLHYAILSIVKWYCFLWPMEKYCGAGLVTWPMMTLCILPSQPALIYSISEELCVCVLLAIGQKAWQWRGWRQWVKLTIAQAVCILQHCVVSHSHVYSGIPMACVACATTKVFYPCSSMKKMWQQIWDIWYKAAWHGWSMIADSN